MTGQPAYTDTDVQAVQRVLTDHVIECTGLGEVSCRGCREVGWMSWYAYRTHLTALLLDAVVPGIVARAKAEALREMAEAMDSGWIDMDDLRYKTTDAPKGWAEPCIRDAWESMSVWAPYLRVRADEIEAGR